MRVGGTMTKPHALAVHTLGRAEANPLTGDLLDGCAARPCEPRLGPGTCPRFLKAASGASVGGSANTTLSSLHAHTRVQPVAEASH